MGVIRVPYSGLENQTLIGYSNDYPKTMFGWDWLLNHEFAHEWFANQLSVANYDDLWLHEGLGSYAQPLISDTSAARSTTWRSSRANAPASATNSHWLQGRSAGRRRCTQRYRPARRHLPQGQLGCAHAAQADRRRGFFRSLRTLVYGRPDPRPGNFTPQFGTTQGFLKIVNGVTGKDYKWFFDVYLYRAALPKVLATRENGKLKLPWQTPDNLPFPMPLDVRVDGKVTLPMTDGTGETPASERAAVTIIPGRRS